MASYEKLNFVPFRINKMAKRNKLQKFAELSAIPFVFQCYSYEARKLYNHVGDVVDLKGSWGAKVFDNDKPIVLELACGRGEYSVALAKTYPDKNFIGVDIKGARLWKGATIAQKEGLTNVAFLRCRIELIESFFAKNEVSEIWITFPDPFLRDAKENRRLTAEPFLEKYKNIIKPDALCHLKTDNTPLYEFSLESLAANKAEVIYQNDDIYDGPLYCDELEIKTYYERQHLENGLKIKYIRWKLI
jgi:tRNA (guanine-N7-)-methyltransferase